MNSTFSLENGSFAIMSHEKETHISIEWQQQPKSSIQLPNIRTHNVELSHVCWLSLGCSKFLLPPAEYVERIFFFSSLISFHINDFGYFVSCWQYAFNMNKKLYKWKQSHRVRLNDTERQRPYICSLMQRRGEKHIEKVSEMHFMYIRTYIFHESVLKHGIGNRINVYCLSQSRRHQTTKWRNCKTTSTKREKKSNQTTHSKCTQRIINETYHVNP